jgi:hypothetical protein
MRGVRPGEGLGAMSSPLAASLKPAFEARKRNAEGARRLLPWHPAVQRTERLDPEVLRVSVHAAIVARGALDLQTALEHKEVLASRNAKGRSVTPWPFFSPYHPSA